MCFKKNKIIALLALVCFPILVFSADFYVSNEGNDNHDGLTLETAWATLAKVNAYNFTPGDNIYFRRGDTWHEALLIPSSGTAEGGYITFGAYGMGDRPLFDGTGVSLPKYSGLIRGKSTKYIIIENLKVQNVGLENSQQNENSGIGFYASDHIIVKSCVVKKIESAGIKMNESTSVIVASNDVSEACINSRSETISISGVDGFEIKHNISHTNGDRILGPSPGGGAGIDAKSGSKNGSIHHNEVYDISPSNAIYVDAYNKETCNIEIYSNYIHDTKGVGIQIGSEDGGDLHDLLIHHNIITNCKRGGFAFHNKYSESGKVYSINIYNNTLCQNGTNDDQHKYFGGVRMWDELLERVTFKNNILSENYHFQIGVNNISPSVVTLDHNVIYGVQGDGGGFTHLDGTNTISSDPIYVDKMSHDFNLQSNSPAINAGDNSVWTGEANITDFNGTPITDGSGNVIVDGGIVSCGALEFIPNTGDNLK
jgi:hypothetical protein